MSDPVNESLFKVNSVGGRQPAYEAASRGRRARTWSSKNTGPNEIVNDLQTIRNRAHQLYRNSGFISNGVEKNKINEVGTGIRLHPQISNKKLRKMVLDLWESFIEQCDSDGNTNFYGLQNLAVSSREIAGECFIRRRIRRMGSGIRVPLQLQIMESDYLPEQYFIHPNNGNEVLAGKEINRNGKVVAYHFYPYHPSDIQIKRLIVSGSGYIRVPASNIIHHYKQNRPGQLRGVSSLATPYAKSKTLEEYEDTELTRKANRAGFTGVITRDNISPEDDWNFDPFTGQPMDSEVGEGFEPVEVQSNTMLQLLPGEQATLFDSDKGDTAFDPFTRNQRLSMAAGLSGIPYELLTGDYKGVNDRLIRAIMNQYQRQIETLQETITVHQICKRVYGWFMDVVVAVGLIDIPDYSEKRHEYLRALWIPQAWKYIHPEQDINATIKAIGADLESVERFNRSRGVDMEDILDSRKRYQDEVKKRKLSGGGDSQQTTSNNPSPTPPVNPNKPSDENTSGGDDDKENDEETTETAEGESNGQD